MARETRETRVLRNLDILDYNVLVGSRSIMLLPIDPEKTGVADVLYIFDPDRYPGWVDVLIRNISRKRVG